MRRLVILINQDWFFLSHFCDRAIAAREAGYEVTVVVPDDGRLNDIKEFGFNIKEIKMSRHGVGLVGIFATILQIRKIYREINPNIVWQIGLKSIVLGTAAAKSLKSDHIVNAVVGMGSVYSTNSVKSRVVRLVMRYTLRLLLNPPGSKVVFENSDDLQEMIKMEAVRSESAVVIQGAGVDLGRFRACPEKAGTPIVLFASRLIREKGIEIFVDAARQLRSQGENARFVVAGGIDVSSRSAVPEVMLSEWQADGTIEWWGKRGDMPEVLAQATIFCLPTWYREGLPKVILEAMACERAVITTDVVGCREIVHHLENGMLIPPQDAGALANSIRTLLHNSELRGQLARRGRETVQVAFDTETICRETIKIFDEMCKKI